MLASVCENESWSLVHAQALCDRAVVDLRPVVRVVPRENMLHVYGVFEYDCESESRDMRKRVRTHNIRGWHGRPSVKA